MEEKLDQLNKNVEDLASIVGKNQKSIEDLAGIVSKNQKSVEDLTSTVSKNQKNVEDLTEIVVSMKDYMEKNLATKDELAAVEEKLDKKINRVEERLGSKIDGLQRAVDANYERQSSLETRVTKIENVV